MSLYLSQLSAGAIWAEEGDFSLYGKVFLEDSKQHLQKFLETTTTVKLMDAISIQTQHFLSTNLSDTDGPSSRIFCVNFQHT